MNRIEGKKYIIKKSHEKFYDMSKLDPDEKIHVIMGKREDNTKRLETRNIELQKRIYDIEWNISTCIDLLEEGKNEKALKLLKKVFYEK